MVKPASVESFKWRGPSSNLIFRLMVLDKQAQFVDYSQLAIAVYIAT